jgi:hypothetical protein
VVKDEIQTWANFVTQLWSTLSDSSATVQELLAFLLLVALPT